MSEFKYNYQLAYRHPSAVWRLSVSRHHVTYASCVSYTGQARDDSFMCSPVFWINAKVAPGGEPGSTPQRHRRGGLGHSLRARGHPGSVLVYEDSTPAV